MVNRMVDPSHSQVLIDDVDIATRNKVELRRSIGYVMQHAGLQRVALRSRPSLAPSSV